MTRTVAILGPGAVGGTFAVRLSEAHHRTICVGTPEIVGLMALSGITLESNGSKPVNVRPVMVEQLVEPVSLLIVAVKAPYLDEALERVEPEAVEHGVVLPLLNGLEHLAPIRARLGRRVAAASLSQFEAYRVGRMQIVQGTPSGVVTMASDDLSDDELERAAEILRAAGMHVEIEDDEKRVLWRKAARAAVRVERHRSHPEDHRRAPHGPRVASAHGAGAHGGVCGRDRRRRQDDALRSVDADRGDGPAPHDLRGTRRPGRQAARARRDRRERRPRRGATRGPVPGARPARRRSRRVVTSAEAPVAVAFVPARSGSERVPGKNVRPLAGHPLLAYAIETALQSGVFARVVVSTDSEEIAEIARWYGAEVPFLRPAEYATATSPDIEWLTFTLERLGEHYDLFAIVRATNPFRGPDVVRRGLEQLLATPEADSLRAVERVKQHPGKMWLLAEDGRTMSPLLDQSHLEHRLARRPVPGATRRSTSQSSALEIAWTRVVAETGTREGRVVSPFFTEGHEGFNVDDEEDWERAERLLASGAASVPAVGSVAVSSRGMKVASLETLFCDAGWRPWIFLKATTEDGLVGLGGDHRLARLAARPGRDRRGSRAGRRRARRARGRAALLGSLPAHAAEPRIGRREGDRGGRERAARPQGEGARGSGVRALRRADARDDSALLVALRDDAGRVPGR